jgi:DNA-binding CsgD family transcriptional regulator
MTALAVVPVDRTGPEELALKEAVRRAAWEALFEDTDCAVALVDRHGVCRLANSRAEVHLAGGGPLPGRSLVEAWPAAVAVERLSLMGDVLKNGRPLAVVGMLKGLWTRMAMRPLTGGDAPFVLVASRPVTHGYPVQFLDVAQVVYAKVHDLGPLACLSLGEIEVLRLMGLGLASRQIARRLFRSLKTINHRRERITEKLGLHGQLHLAHLAIASGLTMISEAELPQICSHQTNPPAGSDGDCETGALA